MGQNPVVSSSGETILADLRQEKAATNPRQLTKIKAISSRHTATPMKRHRHRPLQKPFPRLAIPKPTA
jgi:hypothetical protein